MSVLSVCARCPPRLTSPVIDGCEEAVSRGSFWSSNLKPMSPVGKKWLWREAIGLSGTTDGLILLWYHVLNRRGLALFQSHFRLASVDGTITVACVVSVRHFCPCNPASTPHWTWINTRCRKANEESVTWTKAPPAPLTCTLIYLSGVGKLTFSLRHFSFCRVFAPLFFWMQLELKQNTLLNQDGFDKARGRVLKKSWFSKRL